MSYVAFRPTVEVTEEMRDIFVRIALESGTKDDSLFCIVGDAQTMVRGKGSLLHEGRYLLNHVARHWDSGHLCACTASHKGPASEPTYRAQTPYGIVVSTAKVILRRAFPTCKIEALPFVLDTMGMNRDAGVA